MTTTADDIKRIQSALREYSDADCQTAALKLLETIGYRSERTLALSGDVDDFIETFDALNPDTKTERRFREHTESVKLIFQLSDSEITKSVQSNMFDTGEFDKGNERSFLFASVELIDESYSRGEYALFTREINKRFDFPTVVVFRTSNGAISVSFANRRASKLDADRVVLGNVSLIREIDPQKPHRAHLDILNELSLDKRLNWMDSHDKSMNFDGLLAAWLDALDTEELNKRFYRELFNWFERAKTQAKFPSTGAKVLSAEEQIIRLITRMLFAWFVKEKGLIHDDLFNEERINRLLHDYHRNDGDSYYRAVLQNLFFATLNSEIGQRDFGSESQPVYADFSRYRYKSEISEVGNLLHLFKRTPFINGGLFDCLDSEANTDDDGWRMDCFTDSVIDPSSVEYGMLSIPNRLFFGEDGLIDLLDHYKFTVEENTPAEQEVALDPELLGKVFENLLAAYNPETRETVRKQTGSYYTPRVVVDYMVDEALVASLSESVKPDDADRERLSKRLRYLLDYADAFSDANDLFTSAEREAIVRAIAEIKILDPAVGSGAFPMSILHKLTLALSRLDERNVLWEALQKERAAERASAAFDTSDQHERDDELKEISETFEKYRDSDFGRKLYLIQNSIFGVDIQPVATQIAKLRFFISLAIEQRPDYGETNIGIQPLPNLETRFAAANTLLALSSSAQLTLGQTEHVNYLQRSIDTNRERHFHANTRNKKNDCRNEDKRLRQELASALKEADFVAGDADKIADWDPYDQNASADWFDTGYMFGVSEGFDIVIGNPPYIELQKNRSELGRLYKDAGYRTFVHRGDIYQLFYERGMGLAKSQTGLLAYITSNSWLKGQYGKSTRRYFTESHTPLQLIEMGKDVFETAIVDSSILLMREGRNAGAPTTVSAVDLDRLSSDEFPPAPEMWGRACPDDDKPWSVLSNAGQRILDKMLAKGTPLKDWDVGINSGVKTGYNDAFIIDTETRDALVAADPKSVEIIKPVLRGRDIQRYQAQWADLWLIVAKYGSYKTLPEDYPAIHKHLLQHEDRLRNRGQCRYSRSTARNSEADYPGQHHWLELDNNPKKTYLDLFTKEKLVWMDLTERGRFSYDRNEMMCVNTVFIMTGKAIKYLCAVLNSTLITWFMGNTALNSGMGVTRWIGYTVEQIPIPLISASNQRPFIALIDRILQAKASDPQADTTELEEEIDRLVYDLYGLTDEEVSAITKRFWDSEVGTVPV